MSLWKHSAPARTLNQVRLRRADPVGEIDAILQIGDIARTKTPFYFFQDLSYDLLLDLSEAKHGVQLQFSTLSHDTLCKLRDRQRELYAQAAGVLVFSQWLGNHLVNVSGVPADRVHVVNPGATAAALPDNLDAVVDRRLNRRRTRLLFVGRDFERKGGFEVVKAFTLLRKQAIGDLTLTVAGPSSWPGGGTPPEGVDFRGSAAPEEIAALYDSHDLFVLPSHFEAFGIVFGEALSRGVPCIGRDAFAMPEIITEGKTGYLVKSEEPQDLADLIATALANDDLVRTTGANANLAAEHYTWTRAAREAVTAMTPKN
jgi:glycosyltransferase involved in cell wall biosynthesis